MGGHDPEGPGKVDSGNLDGSLQLSKGRKRADKFAVSKFSTHINPKDGHAVVDCVDPRKWRVLEFVVPILYLEANLDYSDSRQHHLWCIVRG